jgi:serine/threonine protein kinase/tetratricopeptide (TPR) repeat protein
MIGKTISHYRILEKIGGGGMGVVYKAEDTKLKRTVALKFLPTELTHDPEAKKRFVQEARAASALDHPNICNIHEIDETDDGRLFISMACYIGETLKKKIERGPLEFEEAIRIITQVAEGLAKAHAQGIVHRDIKPANIFITNEGQVKIVDFGLAKLAGETKITRRGQAMGTAAYMSPEQIRGVKIDKKTDVWSLGVVLYEMLSGKPPFKGDNWDAIIYSIFYNAPNYGNDLPVTAPLELQGFFNRMLNKDPQQRYSDTSQIITDLNSITGEQLAESYARQASAINRLFRNQKVKRYFIPGLVCTMLLLILLITKTRPFSSIGITTRKPIAIMAFKNLTGDHNLGYLSEVISNLLITNLEQSERLSVMTWERMHDLLKAMGKHDIEEIDKDLGFDLCRRDGVDNIVLGSYTKADELFATDVKVMDVRTKKIIKSISTTGNGISSILEYQIDELSRGIAQGVGLTDTEINNAQFEITDVTTSSMEAYNYYRRGTADFGEWYHADALRFLKRAVEIDSTFAMAHYYLALTYMHLRDVKAEREAFEEAMRFSHKATERERLWIEGRYAMEIEGNRAKWVSSLEKIVEKYPKEKNAHLYLGAHYVDNSMFREGIEEYKKELKVNPSDLSTWCYIAYPYAYLGQYDRAIESIKKYAYGYPGDANPLDSWGEIYFIMGEIDSAITKFQEVIALHPNHHHECDKLAYCYALIQDYEEALYWTENLIAIAPSPGIEAEGYWWRGFFRHWLGQLDKSLEDIEKSIELYKQVNNAADVAYVQLNKAWVLLDKGQFEMSQNLFDQWLENRIVTAYPIYYSAYYDYCQANVALSQGKTDSAMSICRRIDSLLPYVELASYDYDTQGQIRNRHDLLISEVNLTDGKPELAIAYGENPLPMTAGNIDYGFRRFWNIFIYNVPFHKDLLARAYHANGNINKAIAEYERILVFNPKSEDRRLIHPLYHYRLAKLYEEKGAKTKAIKEYQKFLEFWKNADADRPEKTDARKRLAKLKAT